MTCSSATLFPPAQAFDMLAGSYDAVFTDSMIGRAQRDAVWKHADSLFCSNTHLLELNCGTGEDAVHFAKRGLTVTAIDVSEAMILQARQKAAETTVSESIDFSVLAIENLAHLRGRCYDGVFSNFSGLNCIANLASTAVDLAELLPPGAPLLLCFSTRFCVWEVGWYLLHGSFRKAFRRWKGHHETRIGGTTIRVYYPTLKQLQRDFAPAFRVVGVNGIGVAVPPSYAEDWVCRRPRLLRFLQFVDSFVHAWRGLRVVGDHMLLHLERVSA